MCYMTESVQTSNVRMLFELWQLWSDYIEGPQL
jgi:hypothetical protein